MKKTVMVAFILFLFLFPYVMADTPTASQLSPRKFPYWGFMLYQDYELYLDDFVTIIGGETDDYYYWGMAFSTSFHMIGVGRHQIRCERSWDVYYYDCWSEAPINFSKIRHSNDSDVFTEDLWSFRPFIKPHIHPQKKCNLGLLCFVIINASISSDIYLDDELVWHEEIIGYKATPQNPYVCNEFPLNESYQSDPQPGCGISVVSILLPPPNNNTDVHMVNVSWYENTTGSWVLRQTDKNVTIQGPDTTIRWTYTQADQYDTMYWWKVIVDDGTTTVTKLYHFKTKKSRFSLPLHSTSDSFYESVVYPNGGSLDNGVIRLAYDTKSWYGEDNLIWFHGLGEKQPQIKIIRQ